MRKSHEKYDNQILLPFAKPSGFLDNAALSQTPAPEVQTLFNLPLTDKTTAQAVILPTLDGQAFLVYATSAGRLGIYCLIPTTAPEPTPPTPLPPTPIPPTPIPPTPITQKLYIAIVENPRETTQEQKAVMVDKEWRSLAVDKHNFIGLIPSEIKEIKTGLPPASLLPFLNAAKGHNLPCIVIFNKSMSLVYAAELPVTSAEITAIIHKYGG